MRDADFMLAVLRETPGEWVAQGDILNRSFADRGCGLTVHSRAATLRDRGHDVECKVEQRGGRRVSFYRLRSSLDTAASSQPEVSPGAAVSSEESADRGPDSPSLFETPASAQKEAPAWA